MKLLTDNLEIGTFITEQLNEILPTYPIISDKPTESPFCVYRRTGFVSKNTKDRFNYEETINIEIILCATTYKDSIKLAQQVKDKLEGFYGRWRNTFINVIFLDNTNEDWSNDMYIQRLYFTLEVDNGKIRKPHRA